MSKKHLTNYVESKNRIRRLFGDAELDVNNLSTQNVQDLLASIEGDLSPENLTCDGELRGAKLRAKQAMILGARNELDRLVETA